MLDILLTTYNGERYLANQLDSIFGQNYREWTLIVRDDGSIDRTPKILESYRNKYPDKVIIISDGKGNVGVVQSFSILMLESNAEYIAFCDQDDIWKPEKLDLQIGAIKQAEKNYGINAAVLIQSDLCVVDSQLNILSDSFWKYQNLDPVSMNTLHVLLLQNYVTGCTCLINKKLCDLAKPLSNEIIMHDWWLGLIALTSGKIILMDEKLVYYRQHGGNQVGASRWGLKMFLESFSLMRIKKIRNGFQKKKKQAIHLLEFGGLNVSDKSLVMQFVSLYDVSWFKRRVILMKSGFRMYGSVRNFLMYLLI